MCADLNYHDVSVLVAMSFDRSLEFHVPTNEPRDFVSDTRSQPADKRANFELSRGHVMMVVLGLCMPVTVLRSLLHLVTGPGLEVLGSSKKQSHTGNGIGLIGHLTHIPLEWF